LHRLRETSGAKDCWNTERASKQPECGQYGRREIIAQFVSDRSPIKAGHSARDAGKKIKGKKRHILVDTLGLLLHAVVHRADIQDRDGGILLLASLFGMYPFLKKLFADAAYQGPGFHTALAKVLPHLETEIVRRADQAKGFVVLPKRWIVERTIAWLNRCRRLAKDWENLNRKALAFLRLASIRLMLRKLCNPA
jgi:transposase